MIQFLPTNSTPLLHLSLKCQFQHHWRPFQKDGASVLLALCTFCFFFQERFPCSGSWFFPCLLFLKQVSPGIFGAASFLFPFWNLFQVVLIPIIVLTTYQLFPHLLCKFFKQSHLVYLVHFIFNIVPSVQNFFFKLRNERAHLFHNNHFLLLCICGNMSTNFPNTWGSKLEIYTFYETLTRTILVPLLLEPLYAFNV